MASLSYKSVFAQVGFILMVFGVAAAGDMWTYFHPEAVTSMKCEATTVMMRDYGNFYVDDKGVRHEIYVERYVANAVAEREGMDRWSKELGVWEVNDKGRDNAVDACKVWIKVAAKKVRIAHGGTK